MRRAAFVVLVAVALAASLVNAAVLTADRPPIVIEPPAGQDDTAAVWLVRVRGDAPTSDELASMRAEGLDVLEQSTYNRRAGTLLRVRQHPASGGAAAATDSSARNSHASPPVVAYHSTLARLRRVFHGRDSGAGSQSVIAEPERAVHARVVWNLDRVDQHERPLDNTYTPKYSGAGVRIYIVDTGVDVTLSNFGGRASNGYTAYSSNYADQNGHGTHCAGTAASATYGVAKQALIVNVKVLGATGSGTTGTLSGGLAWILANGVTPGVVSASLGMLGESSVVTSYCEDLIDAGFTLVAAAGNDDLPACMHFPSAVPGVLSVVASNINDVGASFNNYGACTDIFAPGVSVTSLQPGGGTATLQGTSMATPHAAGACALILEQMPDAHSSEVFAALFEQATAGEMSNTKTSPNLLLYVESDGDTTSTSGGGGGGGSTASGGGSSSGGGGGGGGSSASTASSPIRSTVLNALLLLPLLLAVVMPLT